ncbi:hypothetical protein D3C87_94510 [compost metagenome]
MRKSTRLVQLTFVVSLFSIILFSRANAQCSVVSTDGYVVNVSIVPRTIVVSSTNCPWGYNYNVGFDYNISITGPGAAAQYTLQALIYCVNGQINGAYSLPLNGGTGTAVTTTNPAIPHNGSAYGYNSPYVSCTNATVATLNCNSVDLIIQGPGIPYQVIHCNPPATPPTNLPVEFLYFDAEKKNKGNLLTWAVETEKRNEYFTIEASTDAQDWRELTKVKGAVNSTEARTYTYFDTKHTEGSVYYRLSQTDLDGTRNELAMKYVASEASDFRLYPNPSADGKVRLIFTDNSENASFLVLRNELGQIVHQLDLEAASKSGKTAYYDSFLDFGQPAGLYLVEVHSGNEVVNRSKLVIR